VIVALANTTNKFNNMQLTKLVKLKGKCRTWEAWGGVACGLRVQWQYFRLIPSLLQRAEVEMNAVLDRQMLRSYFQGPLEITICAGGEN